VQQRAVARPRKMLDAWTRTLSHGGKVNLVAVARPRVIRSAGGTRRDSRTRSTGGNGADCRNKPNCCDAPHLGTAQSGRRLRRRPDPRAVGHSRYGIASCADDWPETPGSQLVIVPSRYSRRKANGGSRGIRSGAVQAAQRLSLREEAPLEGLVFFLDDREPYPFDRQRSPHMRCSVELPAGREVRLFAVDKMGREYASEWPPEVRSSQLPLPRRTEAVNDRSRRCRSPSWITSSLRPAPGIG